MKVSNYTSGNKMIKPVSFTVEVNGNELTATIIEIIEPHFCNEFVITFSDGYTDTFQMTEEGTIIPENRFSGKHYATAVQEDMEMLGLLRRDDIVWCIRHLINDKLCNVWIKRQKRDAGVIYAVEYMGQYQFHFKQEEGQWISQNASKVNLQPINEEVAGEALKLIKKEYLNIPFELA